MSFSQCIIAVTILHLAVSTPIPFYKELTPEEAARLAAWTPESKQNSWALSGQFEGDILLRPDQRNGLMDEKYRWPNAVIPYEISSDFTEAEKQFIMDSLQEEYSKTCITVRPRKEEEVDYVHIIGTELGCFAYIGYIGGPQILNLDRNSGCIWKGTIAHEFLHSAGFWHQQNVPDRNNYVDVIWKNIMINQTHNFKIYNDLTSFGEEYDYGSVMHYGMYDFSSNGGPTIIPKNPNEVIGQNMRLSETDINKLNKMYKCN